jgi:hypothetical protein
VASTATSDPASLPAGLSNCIATPVDVSLWVSA